MRYRNLSCVLVISIFSSACSSNNDPGQGKTEVPVVPQSVAAVPPEAGVKGQVLFRQQCGSCHGNDGTAGIGNATNLRSSVLGIDALTATITNGRNSMPSFGAQLSTEAIADLVGYVLSLRQ